MINKRNKSYLFCLICFFAILFLGLLYFDSKTGCFEVLWKCVKGTNIKEVVNVVAILSGISGILVGAASIRISNLSAVREYFQQGDTTEFIEARKNIYAKIDQNIKIDKNDVEASRIVAFFHF